MRYKKLYSFAAILVIFGMVSLYFYNSVPAKQNRKEITLGTRYYRDFLVDNVYHSEKNGDIHYSVYFPDNYDGKKKMALYITLPGY